MERRTFHRNRARRLRHALRCPALALAAGQEADQLVVRDRRAGKPGESAEPAGQRLQRRRIPDDELTIDFRGSELDKQLRVAMLSGSGPDVVYTAGPSYVAAMAQAGQLLPLDDYAQKLGWNDRILPVFLELGKYNGKLYALPKTYETLGLFYNKTLFDEERLDGADHYRRARDAGRCDDGQGHRARSPPAMPTGARPTSTMCRSCSTRSPGPTMSTRR